VYCQIPVVKIPYCIQIFNVHPKCSTMQQISRLRSECKISLLANATTRNSSCSVWWSATAKTILVQQSIFSIILLRQYTRPFNLLDNLVGQITRRDNINGQITGCDILSCRSCTVVPPTIGFSHIWLIIYLLT
jgi:hypothetical protein